MSVACLAARGADADEPCSVGERAASDIDLVADVFEPFGDLDLGRETGSWSTTDDGRRVCVGVPSGVSQRELCGVARRFHDLTGLPVVAVAEDLHPASS